MRWSCRDSFLEKSCWLRPKSAILRVLLWARMLSGLMSLCMMLYLQRSSNPLTSCLKQKRTSSSVLSLPSFLSFQKKLGRSLLLQNSRIRQILLFLISPITSSILMILGFCLNFSKDLISCRVVATMSSIFLIQEVFEGTWITFIANLCTLLVITYQKQQLNTQPQEPAPNLQASPSLQWQKKTFFMPFLSPTTDQSFLQFWDFLTAYNQLAYFSCSSLSAMAVKLIFSIDYVRFTFIKLSNDYFNKKQNKVPIELIQYKNIDLLSHKCILSLSDLKKAFSLKCFITVIKLMKHSNVSYSDMCESMNINAHDVSSDSSAPEYRVNVVGLHHLPRSLSKQFSDVNDSFSIDEFNSNSHKHPEVFKCFKCYGLGESKQLGVAKKCRECQGTSFVTDSHPLVSILEQIISKQVPELSSKQENSKKRKLNRRYTIQKEYTFPDTIKEQSFSVQEEHIPTCKNCLQQCETNYHKCDRCPNLFVCSSCFYNNRYYHHHKLFPKEVSVMTDLNDVHALKKISEQVQSLEAQNLFQEPFSKRQSCKKPVQACFVSCKTCSAKGVQFMICDQCYQSRAYQHDSGHQLTIKTSAYEPAHEMNFEKNSVIDPLLKSQDNSQKIKQANAMSNSFVNFGQEIGLNGSQISRKVPSISDNSELQHQLEQLKEAQTSKNNLFKSCKSQQEHEDFDFSLRFSQNREEGAEQISIKYLQAPAQQQPKSRHSEHSINTSPELQEANQRKEDRKIGSKTDRSNPEQYVFKDYRCDICGISPILNRKYHCDACPDFDLCEDCYVNKASQHEHNNFTLKDGRQLKQQRIFLARSYQDKGIRTTIGGPVNISKRGVQSKPDKKYPN